MRALLAVGVLALLCVSDGVGPRLLPLPTLHERSAAASRLPSRGRTAVRVEMTSGPQTQAATTNQSQQVVAHTQNFILSPPYLVVFRGAELHPGDRKRASHIFRPLGRAPPRLRA